MSAQSLAFDSLCHFNPTANSLWCDPMRDCGAAARWHGIKRPTPISEVECYQACETHLANMLLLDGVEEFHEFTSGCGLEGSYWVENGCSTAEVLLVNGLAWYEGRDVYDKPTHPLPGTYIHETDTDRWLKFDDGLWVESEPAPGAPR